ncbi:MAG: alkaline phosphatase D family protein [Gammaproteobacteria bacterium]|nr:alkaline phosphatase D family protein [Gammaproteobacteria bacterium]
MLTRRQFVCNASLLAFAGCQAGEPVPRRYPFTLGVASGDPTASSVVLWTRLAPEPLNDGTLVDELGVDWVIASDAALTQVVQTGQVMAQPGNAHCVHVEPTKLRPNTVYYYQFEASGASSPIGRTKTLPRPGTDLDKFTIALTSCMEYSLGYFSALRDLVVRQPDLVIHNGDYIYEAPSGTLRPYPVSPEARTLADYRSLYAQYRQDAALREAHAQFPWIVLWDDHEVVNDSGPNHYLPSSRNAAMSDSEYKLRRSAATKAFLEHMPLRAALPGRDRERPVFYERQVIGNLLELSCLDVRSYRDTPVCIENKSMGFADCADAHNPARSMLGETQEQWLYKNFGSAGCKWNGLVQTTVMAPFDRKAGPEVNFETDGWDNYAANRDRILQHIEQHELRNCVTLGGNIHAYYAGTVGTKLTEIVTTSVTASGGGSERYDDVNGRRDENPGLQYFDNRYRGYTLLEFDQNKIAVTLRTVSDIEVEDSPVSTLATLSIDDGKVGATVVGGGHAGDFTGKNATFR